MSAYHRIFEDMITMDICPLCKEDLIVKKEVEQHGDNSLFNEYITKKYCPNHGDCDEINYEDMEEDYEGV